MKYKTEFVILFFLLGFFSTLIYFHLHSFHRFSQDNFTSFVLDNNQIETYENKPTIHENIDFYVITMNTPERIENINEQIEKLKTQGTPIHLEPIDAVVGVDLNLNDLIKTDLLSPNFKSTYDSENLKKKEIGCYMSHLKIHELIQQKQNATTNNEKKENLYSVIFEDDFDIVSDNFSNEIENAIETLNKNQIDFDILFLGVIVHDNYGELLENHTYKIDKKAGLYGTHAMLLNNKKIDKIINSLKPLKQPIDEEFTELCHSDKLTAYIIEPNLVKQQPDKLNSTINSEKFNLDRRRFESEPADSSSLSNPRKEFKPLALFEFFKGIMTSKLKPSTFE